MSTKTKEEIEKELVGFAFLDLIRSTAKRCEDQTDGRVANLGQKTPACLENIGTVLSLADRMASCFWKCRGGDHHIEYLIGRAASTTAAALSLTRQGFYDECLSLTRSVGEIANLLILFASDSNAHDDWHAATAQQRKQNFSPVKVRLQLEDVVGFVPVDQERYAQLCEIATHVTPHTTPQAYNPIGMPSCCNVYQDVGVMMAINEIALPLAFVVLAGGKLLECNGTQLATIGKSASSLFRSIGAIGVTELEDVWQRVTDTCSENAT